VGFDDLGVRESWLARCEEWGLSLKAAVESEIARAKQRGMAFSEVGGWAIVPEKRSTSEALRIALATYSLARILGAVWASARLPSGTVPPRFCGGLGAARWSTAELNCLRITTLNTGAGWKFCDSIRVRRMRRAADGWNN
jgi:hypothetical protein